MNITASPDQPPQKSLDFSLMSDVPESFFRKMVVNSDNAAAMPCLICSFCLVTSVNSVVLEEPDLSTRYADQQLEEALTSLAKACQ